VGGCKEEGVSVPPIFFVPKNNFGGYRVEKEQIEKLNYFQNFNLGGVKTEKK